MIIVIGKKDLRIKSFLKTLPSDQEVFVTDRMCEIKRFKEEVTVYVPFTCLCRDGSFYLTSIWLDELLTTLKVKEIIYGDRCNEKRFWEICDIHKVKYRYQPS